LNLHGGGSIATAGAADLKITLDRFAVSDLAAMLPALRDTPAAGSQVGLTAAVSGDPAQLGSLKVAVSDLYFAKGKSSLTGTLTAENLVDAPRIRFDLNAPVLDVDELFPPGPPQPEAKSEPAKAPPLIVKKIDAQGRITVGHGVARKFPFNNFTASLTMKNGVAKFDKLDLDSYDGHFSAAPTSVDVGSAQPAFDAHVAMKDVNADRLLTEQASLPHTLSGRMSTEIALSGKGAGWDQLSKTLSGDLGMALANGRFEKLDFGQALLGNVARQLPMLKLPASTGSTALRDLAARFEVADGQMKLKQPLKAMTAQGPLELEGGIGLDASLHLTGHMTIDPAAIAALTANKVRPAKAIPVALKLGGTLTHPEISGVEAEALVALLTTELAKSLGAEKLLEAQKQAEAAAAKAKAEAEKRVADAKAQAQKAANDAKAKADELAAKAKAEAEKKKKEAKKKAEEEAKKALKGVF
jgi:AsmA protein